MSELFDAVDALIASRSPLPPPAERRRLRQAHGLTLDEVAAALRVRRATVSGWEAGRTEPRPPERDAYARMLEQLAQLYPADPNAAAPATDTAVPETLAVPSAPASTRAEPPKARTEPPKARTEPTGPILEPASENTALRPAAVPHPAAATRPTSRRPPARKAALAGTPAGSTDTRFENGPLVVVDVDAEGQAYAYGVGGLVLNVPAKTIPSLVEWALKEAKLGQPKLSGPGKDADPLRRPPLRCPGAGRHRAAPRGDRRRSAQGRVLPGQRPPRGPAGGGPLHGHRAPGVRPVAAAPRTAREPGPSDDAPAPHLPWATASRGRRC